MGETYQNTRVRLNMLRQKKMKERERTSQKAPSQSQPLVQKTVCSEKTQKKKKVEDKQAVEQLVNFIEGVETKQRNEKRAAKKARQREKKRLEEEERARQLAEEEERKRREEALLLALQRQAELKALEASKNKKKRGKKSRGSQVPGGVSLDNKKTKTGETGGNIVTIRRLVDQPSSKTFVTTVTLKGNSTNDDKLLYKFYSQDNKRPVLNYQTVDSEQYEKRTSNVEAFKSTNFPSVIIGRNDANHFVPLKVNNAVNNTPSKASPKAFNIKDIKLPPCITITVKPNSVENSPKENERENAEPAKKARRRRRPKQVA